MRESICFIFLFVQVCTGNAQRIIDPEDNVNWQLVWLDEFNYSNREELLLEWEAQNASSNHILCSRWEDNIEVADGKVRLVNKKEKRGGQEWTSGSMWTRRNFKYGYFECKYKYANATGTNNSFWLMTRPADSEPREGKRFEIDVNEGHCFDEVNTNIHDWSDSYIDSEGNSKHPTSHKSYTCPHVDFSQQFHLFGLEWTEKEIIFYLDRKEIRRVKNDFCFSPAPVMLSLAIINWAGEVTNEIDQTFMEIDYVKIYKNKN